MMRQLFSLVALVLMVASPAVAEPEEVVVTNRYEVSGYTVEEIRAAMTANTPHEFWGTTEWYVSWTSDCEVTVKITFTYPEWTDYDDAGEELQDDWDKFIENLEIHEEGHADNGRGAGQEIEDTQCREDPYAIIRNWGREDRNYDAETAHGQTQGAVF